MILLMLENKKGGKLMGNLNPFERFKDVYNPPLGTMVYDLVIVNGQTEFAFCIKEAMRYINKYKYPLIEIRMGIQPIDNVLIVPIMLMVNNDKDMLYETMFNYYQTSGGQKYLDALKKQDDIKILFFNEMHKNVRQISVKNRLQDKIKVFEEHLQKATPWSMQAFDYAKEELYKMYPTGIDLWKALGENTF